MSVISKNFDTYQYGYVSDAGFDGNVNACEINCYKAGVQVARICLIKSGASMPANAVHSGVLYLYYPLSQFGDISGMFRYEKVLNISLDTSSNVGGINNAMSKPGPKLP